MKKIILVGIFLAGFVSISHSQDNNYGRYQIVSLEYDRGLTPPQELSGLTTENANTWKNLNANKLIFKIDTLSGRTWVLSHTKQEDGSIKLEWIAVQ